MPLMHPASQSPWIQVDSAGKSAQDGAVPAAFLDNRNSKDYCPTPYLRVYNTSDEALSDGHFHRVGSGSF
jgi:hypothetical protein